MTSFKDLTAVDRFECNDEGEFILCDFCLEYDAETPLNCFGESVLTTYVCDKCIPKYLLDEFPEAANG